jgi:hypothetical protein
MVEDQDRTNRREYRSGVVNTGIVCHGGSMSIDQCAVGPGATIRNSYSADGDRVTEVSTESWRTNYGSTDSTRDYDGEADGS